VNNMIRCCWLFYLLLNACQAGPLPPTQDGLLPAERERLSKEEKIDNRIKIYETATERIRNALHKTVTAESYSDVPALLSDWQRLLATSTQDIEDKVSRKKRSRNLIHFEIQLRKAIADVQNYKLKAPIDLQQGFENWLADADKAHNSFVDILFPK
jgi:hypothetical protein